MRKLMENTGETANLGVEKEGSVLFLSQLLLVLLELHRGPHVALLRLATLELRDDPTEHDLHLPFGSAT